MRREWLANTALDRRREKKIKRSTKRYARVVFCTGDVVSVATKEFLAKTGRPVLEKPFDLDQVVETVAGVAGS